MLFSCPKCLGKLNINESGTAVCQRGHSYDKSRFGYYNLLLSERGGTHGDNKDMVLARREFLSRGFYEQLARELADICEREIAPGGALLDAGCGEGYYTAYIKKRIRDKCAKIAAFDISKDAVRQAARRDSADEYAVAGSYHMPICDETFDIVLNTFSPLAAEQTHRVLKRGGKFVMAIPAEEHLFGLKSAIYDTPYKNTVEDTSLDGFLLSYKKELKYIVALNNADDIRALFMMTPYAYRTSAEGRGRVLSLSNLETAVHFIILVYEKQ